MQQQVADDRAGFGANVVAGEVRPFVKADDRAAAVVEPRTGQRPARMLAEADIVAGRPAALALGVDKAPAIGTAVDADARFIAEIADHVVFMPRAFIERLAIDQPGGGADLDSGGRKRQREERGEGYGETVEHDRTRIWSGNASAPAARRKWPEGHNLRNVRGKAKGPPAREGRTAAEDGIS